MRSAFVVLLWSVFVSSLAVSAQTPGQNTNMVSGTQFPGGDPYLQRQNEPSVAISTRNPRHILAGANDYRTVDLQVGDVLPGSEVTGDAWLGVFKSFDGGQTWQSTLLPGYPQDNSAQGAASPLKGFKTAADPTVRPGTNGTFYYSGIAFNRGTNQGVVFVARYIDLNNKENGNAAAGSDAIVYLGAATVDHGTAGQFLDKPTIAVDVPRGSSTCTFQVPQGGTSVSQTIPAGNIYLAYTILVGNDINIRTKLYLARSTDCGVTWSQPTKLSEGLPINQGSVVAIDPTTGYVYVAWRGFATNNTPNTINIVRSTDGGATFTKAQTIASLPSYNSSSPAASAFFDQGTTATSFRTNAFPAMTVDASGRVYVAWSQRGPGPGGDARIVVTSTADFVTWSAPQAADNAPLTDDFAGTFTRGHQFMPTMTFTDGRLMLLYYDERFDHTIGLFTPNDPFAPGPGGRFYTEKRDPRGEALSNPAAVYTPFVSDAGLTQMRHTIELRVAQATPAAAPAFTSVRLSQYKFGTRGDESGTVDNLQQLQINPPNLPLFQNGSAPFLGDYIDIAGLAMVNTPTGWKFNTGFTKAPVHIATFTSNQDVRPPADGNWQNYTPAGPGGQSTYDPTVSRPNCLPGQEGMRNQNIYSSVITQGLAVSAQQNSKPLSTTVPREFVLTVQNATNSDKSFRLTITNQPPAGIATFVPIPNPIPSPLPAAVVTLDVSIAAHSGIARGVYALSSSPTATIRVNVDEVDGPGGSLNNGLSSFVALNADPTVPALTNPDGTSGVGISTAEIYNPNISNPNVSNPNVSNPNVSNPNVSNPNVSNPNVSNPNVSNPNVSNPDLANPNVSNPNVSNPNVSNPNVSNPNVSNPNVSNAPLADATYTVQNNGNTSSAYTVKLVGNAPGGTPLQLIVSKPYANPLSEQCTLFEQSNNVVLTNVNNPVVLQPGSFSDPQIANPNISNATLSLGPGEKALVTIRGFNVTVDQMQQLITQVTAVVIAQAPNTNDPTNTPASSAPLFITTSTLPAANLSQVYEAGVQAFGGVAPYTWSAASLPAGITLSPAGELGGTPTVVGTANVAFTVTDSAGNTVTKTIPLRVINRQILIDIPSPGTGGDLVDRGFYVTNYPGLDLQRAGLYFSTRTAGTYTFTLTARAGGYNGPVIGADTQTLTLTADAAPVFTTFDFGSPEVAPGSTVAFTITQVSGPTLAFYAVSTCGLNDPNCTTSDSRVIETEGSSGTTDTFRRVGVAVRIEGTPAAF